MSFDGRIQRSLAVGGYARQLCVYFMLGNFGSFCVMALTLEDEEFKVVEPAKIDKVIAHASLPEVQLAKIEGFETEAAYLQAMIDKSESFAKRAEEEREESVRVDAWLAAANHILAFEIEPVCSRRFHGLEEPDAPISAGASAALVRSEAALGKAHELLELQGKREATDSTWLTKATHTHRTLEAFARGLNEYLFPASGEDQVSKARDAASALAVLMEDGDEEIAAGATLWHAALRARAGELDAALAVLPVFASESARAAHPQAFFARILRCELLARRGGYGAALAVLSKMDEPIAVWFPLGAARDDAMRTLAWTKVRVLKAWHTELSKSQSLAEEAAWCAERMQAIIADRLPEGRRTISRISPVIPIMAKMGMAEAPKPEAGE